MVLRPITAMLIRQLNVVVMNALIGIYVMGTRFEHISAQDLTTTLLQTNQRPLKILNWQTPYQVMLNNLSKNSD